MEFEKITENVENISLLADTPAMTPAQLKAEFDKGNKIIKTKFNKLVDDLNEKMPTLVTEETLKGTTLYESETGSKENITLNESSSNYNVLEIEYRYQGIYNTTKVSSPNGKIASLSIFFSIAQYNAARTQYKTVKINGSSITNEQYGYMSISESQTIGGSTHENSIYITKVVGYKY